MLTRLPQLLTLSVVALAMANAAAQQELEVVLVQGNVYVIAGAGGNTTVQIGPEAVVVVDTKTPASTERLLQAIAKLSPKPIRHVIVTSSDPEHVGGNERLSSAGTYVRLLDTFDPRGSNTKASIITRGLVEMTDFAVALILPGLGSSASALRMRGKLRPSRPRPPTLRACRRLIAR